TAVDVRLRDCLVLYLALYTIILVLGRFTKRPTLAGWIILGLAAAEVSQFGRITAANRETVQKQDLTHGMAARTEPVEMLQDIRGEDNSLFRISTLRVSERGNETDPN